MVSPDSEGFTTLVKSPLADILEDFLRCFDVCGSKKYGYCSFLLPIVDNALSTGELLA